MDIKEGQIIELDITDVSDDGKGFGRAEDLAVFVEGAVPGDRVLAEIRKLKKNFALAVTKEVASPSPFRRESDCPFFQGRDGRGECGGCAYRQLKYEKQLEIKRRQVINKLSRIGGIEKPQVAETVASPELFRYRDKVEFAVKGAHIGFRKRGSHEIADITDCQLLPESVMAVCNKIREFLNDRTLKAYDEKKARGFLRQVTVKWALGTGQMMVIFTAADTKMPSAEKIITAIDQAVEETEDDLYLASVVLHTNKNKNLRDFSPRLTTLAGTPTITDLAEFSQPAMKNQIKYEISPLAFYQINPLQMRNLCSQVCKFAEPDKQKVILDLYCGIGTLGLPLAESSRYIIGIESVKPAIIDANRNAAINGIVNARYYTGKAEEVLPELLDKLEKGIKDNDTFGIPWKDTEEKVVILDPPRKGCDEKLLETAGTTGANRIVYVSCDPGTMARDIRKLGEMGYEFAEAIPFDMFPWTTEIETVCFLQKIQ